MKQIRRALCTCLGCDAKLNLEFHPWLCPLCLSILPKPALQSCLQCACEMPALTMESFENRCGTCLKVHPFYDRSFALFPYEFPISEFIDAFKNQKNILWANFFAHQFLESIPTWYASEALPQVIIPVPLHIKRLTERGFNQSVEIAKMLRDALQLPCAISWVKKTVNTKNQRQLSQKNRAANVKNVFAVLRSVANLHCVILDDVVTSSNTVNSLARALKKAGAARVDIWCCARASLKLK